MRCRCCDRNLSDFESTRKHMETGEYLDMCNECFYASELPDIVPIEEREDLATFEEIGEIVGHDELLPS